MSSVRVAVATPAHVQSQWCSYLREVGARPLRIPLQADPEGYAPDVWLVVLDARHAPVPLKFWLKQLAAPIVLVTPYLTPAQTLCAWVPRLAVICPPLRASETLAHLIDIARKQHGGTWVLEEERALGASGGYL